MAVARGTRVTVSPDPFVRGAVLAVMAVWITLGIMAVRALWRRGRLPHAGSVRGEGYNPLSEPPVFKSGDREAAEAAAAVAGLPPAKDRALPQDNADPTPYARLDA